MFDSRGESVSVITEPKKIYPLRPDLSLKRARLSNRILALGKTIQKKQLEGDEWSTYGSSPFYSDDTELGVSYSPKSPFQIEEIDGSIKKVNLLSIYHGDVRNSDVNRTLRVEVHMDNPGSNTPQVYSYWLYLSHPESDPRGADKFRAQLNEELLPYNTAIKLIETLQTFANRTK